MLKPGMLALISNGPVGENLGRVVTVDYFIGEHTSTTGTTKQDCWSVFTKLMPLKGFDRETGEVRLYRRGIIPGEWLMPIVPDEHSKGEIETHHRKIQ